MLKYFTTFLLLLTVLLQFSCDKKSEQERYLEIMALDSPQQRINDLEKFLSNYPENKNKERILRQLFQDYIFLQDEENTLIYADQYLDYFPKGYRMAQLNSVAWTMAENMIGLDSAKVYADRAVEQAKNTSIGNLNNILSSKFLTYGSSGSTTAIKPYTTIVESLTVVNT